jgi:CRP-like cAMP-binding protein
MFGIQHKGLFLLFILESGPLAPPQQQEGENSLPLARSTPPNRVLAALPRKDYQRLAAELEPVALVFGQRLYEPGGAMRHVYFPGNSAVSLISQIGPGKAAEVGLVGNEGVIGIPVALGIKTSPLLAVVQGTGTALRMKASVFRKLSDGTALQREMFRFTHLLMSQVAQTAACNRFHYVNERLARWLLMTRDRVRSNEFMLTHDFLGMMLGVRRVAVTQAATALQKHKLISYTRGRITVTDPKGLEARACSCYGVVKKMYAHA